MLARLNCALFPATVLMIAIACPVLAQPPEKSAGLEVSASVAGSLIWAEDDMSVPVNIVVHNTAGEDARNIVISPALFSSPDVAAKAGEIFQKGCPDKITADMETHGQSVSPNGTKQTRFVSRTDVEELGPNEDATPVLLVCATYKLTGTGENHRSAILYRLLHIDPVRGSRPVDRVTGDVPAQSLRLEELGRHAK